MRRFLSLLVLLAVVVGTLGCLRTVFDMVTSERVVRVPRSNKTEFTVETGRIDIPTKLGTDKVVDRVTVEMTAVNFHQENPVVVDISAAGSQEPNAFGPILRFRIEPGETRDVEAVQRGEADALVRAVQSDFVNIRFDSTSPRPGIGELEFRFTIHVLAHKRTPGTGAGTLLFY